MYNISRLDRDKKEERNMKIVKNIYYIKYLNNFNA